MKKLVDVNEFNEVKQSNYSVVMFSADWCPDCVVIEPVLPEVEAKFSPYTFYYADRDQFIDLCSDLGIFGIPSFVVFHQGKEINRFVSKERKTKEEIEQFLEKTLKMV